LIAGLPMSKEEKICALIPAFNEAEVIGPLIKGVKEQVEEVLLIDDGSDDGTGDIAEAAGAVCLRRRWNGGKGAALREGLAHIAERDFSHVLFIDGDGQHRPEDIPSLIRVAHESDADLVIGTRTFDRELMPLERYFSNSVGSRIASWLTGKEVKDSQSGFRLARFDRLRSLKLRATRYEIEMEILIKMSLTGCRIAYSPVHMIYQNGKARSKMKPVRDTMRICLWSLGFRFLKL
jgi:glycosyltransferase involved in cell wall biosynthesis